MMRERNNLFLFFFIILALITFACSKPPAMNDVQNLIFQHFDMRGYRVTEIKISKIENIPLRDREYMSTKGHLVHLSSITLEPIEPGIGKAMTYTDAVVEIHMRRDKSMGWGITHISGIPVL